MHAVYFTAKYPERVAALYLDAPVLNLLSCPAGVGLAGDDLYPEFVEHTGMTTSDLFSELKQYLEMISEEENIPACDCIVYHGHDVVFRHMVGYSCKESANSRNK